VVFAATCKRKYYSFHFEKTIRSLCFYFFIIDRIL